MAKIWERDRWYAFLRPYVDYCTKESFGRVKVKGSIPDDGAVLMAPNHTNTLMDALVVLQSRKERTVFGARADIFRKAGKALRFLKILPMARQRDGLQTLRQSYGTFDEVEDTPLLDKSRVTHVRLVDVVGCLDSLYATYDCQGHIINDPWPTPFASSGFDLDAVGVIHDLAHFDVPENAEEAIAMYPNPVRDRLTVKAENLHSVEVFNLVGQMVMVSTSSVIDMSDLNQGVYFVRVMTDGNAITKRIVKQ